MHGFTKMDTIKLRQKIDEQVNAATQQYNLTAGKLKYHIDMFKPDSPKLEIVVSVEIGWIDKDTGYIWNNHFFYSPRKYEYNPVSKLENDIKKYLNSKNLKPF